MTNYPIMRGDRVRLQRTAGVVETTSHEFVTVKWDSGDMAEYHRDEVATHLTRLGTRA